MLQDVDVHGMLFLITGTNTFNHSGLPLHDTFSRTLTHMGNSLNKSGILSMRHPIGTLTQR